MNIKDQESIGDNSVEVSVSHMVTKIKLGIKYIKSKWLLILTISVIGAIAGLGYSIYRKNTYTAVCTFVLEESGKGGGLGQYAGLASLAGINLGGGGGGGIFEGDNILELYKSRIMIKKTLLTEVNINNQKQTLMERYIINNKLREKWKSNDHIDSISFKGDVEKFNRKQDSIITDLVDNFNKKILNVSKPDKKLNIFRVEVVANDELFAKEFTDKLVENVNNFYVQTKTKKSYQSILVLQKQADSVKAVLNSSISGVASAIDAAPNANPSLLSLKVPSQRRQVDVQASTAIYSEIVKNLEISKISLRQETPLIQVIDQPVLPLTKNHLGKIKGIIIGGILAAVAITFILLFNKIIKSIIK